VTTIDYITNLDVSPEGLIDAPRATLIGNRQTGQIFKKTTAEGITTGWVEIAQAGNFSGLGSPEGSLSALAGSTYLDVSDPENPTLYVKVSGVGSTGWRSMVG
jgi:hypothetical protein